MFKKHSEKFKRYFIYILFIIMPFFTLNTCNQPTEVDEGGPGIIVPGISVEGIKLGDSRETVEAKLGKPTSVGWADGKYRGWRLYSYAEGTRIDPIFILQFYFIDKGNDYGPVDEIGIGPAYEGKTEEGIGIGTKLAYVHKVYGIPSESFISDSIITDKYCLNGKKFEIGYKDSVIIGMSTGYFEPMPQDNPCK